MDSPLQTGMAPPQASKRRVLIVDDHDFFAACLRTLLNNESDLVVCDITADSADLRERVERLRPDLLVIDLSLGTENGLELGRRLREIGIATPILFVSTMTIPSREQIEAIASAAFIPKSRAPAEFLAALRAVLTPPAATWSADPQGVSLVPGVARA